MRGRPRTKAAVSTEEWADILDRRRKRYGADIDLRPLKPEDFSTESLASFGGAILMRIELDCEIVEEALKAGTYRRKVPRIKDKHKVHNSHQECIESMEHAINQNNSMIEWACAIASLRDDGYVITPYRFASKLKQLFPLTYQIVRERYPEKGQK